MGKRKYTKEVLAEAAKTSISIAEVMRSIGIVKWSGSQHALIRNRMIEYNIDTSHFLGRRSNSGGRHKRRPREKDLA